MSLLTPPLPWPIMASGIFLVTGLKECPEADDVRTLRTSTSYIIYGDREYYSVPILISVIGTRASALLPGRTYHVTGNFIHDLNDDAATLMVKEPRPIHLLGADVMVDSLSGCVSVTSLGVVVSAWNIDEVGRKEAWVELEHSNPDPRVVVQFESLTDSVVRYKYVESGEDDFRGFFFREGNKLVVSGNITDYDREEEVFTVSVSGVTLAARPLANTGEESVAEETDDECREVIVLRSDSVESNPESDRDAVRPGKKAKK